jgi:2-methylcitrate dehydratase PrpD
LAEWAARAGDHPDRARSAAGDALFDITACVIGGAVEDSTRAMIEVARQAGRGKALAMGSNLRLPAPWAALVTGTAAHALDFDDNFAPGTTHATAVLAPALFALADEEEVSGAEVIDAYIIGLELQARIGHLVNPEHYEKGWHATSTIGAIGAAGGCARLLGLDVDETLAAMSIAFSMAAGSKKQFGSMMKPIHAGLAAKNAVLAARMAQAGVTGDVEPISGRWGFAELYGERSDENVRNALAVRDLGESLMIETAGLMTKRFPCCGAAHRTLDGLVKLREKHGLSLEIIDHVDAFIPAFARANLRFDDPQNENEARFSLTYCAARVLQTGHLALGDLTLERVRDPAIRPWLKRIALHVKPGSVSEELSDRATPAITRVVLENGRIHEASVLMAKGTRHEPFTPEEMRRKFLECCRWGGREREADRLLELARAIPALPRFGVFSEALADGYSSP